MYRDQVEEFLKYDREMESKKFYCCECEKELEEGELVLDIYDELYCIECAKENFGKEIEY